MKLFEPIKIGNKVSKNRLALAPMSTNLGDHPGNNYVNERHLYYYGTRAKNEIGIIIPEGMHVHAGGFAERKSLGVSDDTCIPGLAKLADEVHKYDSLILCQIALGGKAGGEIQLGNTPPAVYSSCAMPHRRLGLVPKQMSIADIENAVELYAQCAYRVKQAGFDGIEVHGGHGYMLMQFISPFYNQRFDEYGGSFKNRIRFPLEIVKRAREYTGDDFIISYRMSAEEYFPKGFTIEEGVAFAKELEQNGIDAIHVTVGSNETPDDQRRSIATMYTPEGYMLPAATKIKEAVSVPVMTAGKLGNPELAKKAVEDGLIDIVALGRPLFADPEWAVKVHEGRDEEVVRCITCNAACIEYINSFKTVCCMQNPMLNKETLGLVKQTKEPKKVLVIGAGLSGMEAAIRAAECGHHVEIWEKGTEPGGQAILASQSHGKEMFAQLIRSRVQKLKKLGVPIVFGKECTPETVAEGGFDKIVCAVGGKPVRLNDKLMNDPLVKDTWEMIMKVGPVEGKPHAVVVGGGSIGLEVAHQLGDLGYKVSVLELFENLGGNIVPTVRWALLRELEKLDVQCITAASIEEIEGNTVYYTQNGVKKALENVTMVLPAIGVKPDQEVFNELKAAGLPVVAAGNCKEPGDGLTALLDSCMVGLTLFDE